ncbi:transcriptional regulator DEF1, partial [Asbolus verrucosus]
AYHRSQSSAVQVAKIIGVTVVLMSVVLGSFLLASAYVTANASCRQLEQELELLSEAADRFQAPPQPEALVQEEPRRVKYSDPLNQEESKRNINEVDNNVIDSSDSETSDSNSDSSSDSNRSGESEEEEKAPIHFKLPLQLDFDDLAGALIEKNQKSRMNCVVEKKRAEEVIDHQPKTLRLPFGLNLTTDPRYERVSGERMAIFCESGNVQKQTPPEDENEEETIMIQPVMIPIPQTHFPTHMAQQLRPVTQQQQFHPMETMRPPMPQLVQQEQQSHPLPNPILHHIAQQIIAQKIMEARQAHEEQQNQEVHSNPEQAQKLPIAEEMIAERIPVPEEVLTQLNRLPNRNVIVTVSRQEPEEVPQESREMHVDPQEMRVIPQEMRMFPEEIRSVLQEIRPVSQEMRNVPPVSQEMQSVRGLSPEMHVVQQQREDAREVNGRQTFARNLPIHIPVHMIQQQDSRAASSEESRPHCKFIDTLHNLNILFH